MKTLRLHRERLADLTPAELASVAGGTVTIGCTVTLNVLCLGHRLSLESC